MFCKEIMFELCLISNKILMNNILKGNGKKQLSKLESTEITYTAQKMKFSIKDLFSKLDQIRSKLRFGHIY